MDDAPRHDLPYAKPPPRQSAVFRGFRILMWVAIVAALAQFASAAIATAGHAKAAASNGALFLLAAAGGCWAIASAFDRRRK